VVEGRQQRQVVLKARDEALVAAQARVDELDDDAATPLGRVDLVGGVRAGRRVELAPDAVARHFGSGPEPLGARRGPLTGVFGTECQVSSLAWSGVVAGPGDMLAR
jgi:hypothetical protein